MSLTREDERQKNGCPSRGFGIAAAAIGVGVGAALYYFFNKRAEQPNSEGSTSDWNCERAQTLHHSSDEYTTISENETSDTSIHDYDIHLLCEKEETFILEVDLNDNSDLATTISDSDEFTNSEDSVSSSSTENIINYSSDPYAHLDSSDISSTYYVEDSTSDLENSTASDSNDDSSSSSSSSNHTSDISETSEYDMTMSSLGIPEHTPERSRSPLQRLFPWAFCSNGRKRKRLTEEQQMAMIRQDQFRERAWTLEPCSICFDMMLRDQELMRLPCAHNFHTQCILPWLQERQTCPVCREVAES